MRSNPMGAMLSVLLLAAALNDSAVLGGVGVAGGDEVGGLALSLLAVHQFGPLEIGADLYGATLYSAVLSMGGLAGLKLGSVTSLHALAAGGVHSYHGVGRGMLT